ncbi:tetratricopeptide repeat protein [Thalassotalea ganghwensis]
MNKLLLVIIASIGFNVAANQNVEEYKYCQSDCEYEVKMFRKYMNQGSSIAEFSLGLMMLQGKGTEQNIEQGIRHIRSAALAKEPSAEFQLGYFYLFGLYVNQDFELAKKFLERAKLRKVKSASKYLSLMSGKEQKSQLVTVASQLTHKVNENLSMPNSVEVITVSAGFTYYEIMEAARIQSCPTNTCGPWWSVVLMPMVKLANEDEVLSTI